MSSKVWVVVTDKNGNLSKTRKELAYEYKSRDEGPSEYTSPIGIVFDHGEPNIYSGDSPAKYIAVDAIVSGIEVNNLVGRLLTLVDATFGEGEQRRALKDLVEQTIWRWNSDNERRVRECFESIK